MAYSPTTWADNDLITADKLNKLEAGVQNEQVGPQGPQGPQGPAGAKGDKGETGAAGKGVKALALTADATGKITGGTVTFSDNSTAAVTVTTAEAG